MEKKALDMEAKLKSIHEKVAGLKSKHGLQVLESDLIELKAFKSPPDKVVRVLRAVMFVLGEKPKTWDDIKKLMGPTFLEGILHLDLSGLTPAIIAEARSTLAGITEDGIRATSQAATVLYCFVITVLDFAEIAHTAAKPPA